MTLTFAVVFERAPGNWGAYVPDLPGCVSVGDTLEETREMIKEAISFHIDGLREDGDEVPRPTRSVVQAMAYHVELIADADEPLDEHEVTVDVVRVDTELRQAAAVDA